VTAHDGKVPQSEIPDFPGVTGHSVLITGAGRGVGRGIAHAFAASGASVVIADLRPETGDEVAAEIRARGGTAASIGCDVTRRADVEAAVAFAVERYGKLDSLIHNAVSPITTYPHELEALTSADWQDHANVSVRALLYCTQSAYPHLRASRGSLVIVVSVIGIEGDANRPLYAAVKGAQRGFLKSLAREWAPEGIRVNGMGPLAFSPTMEASFQTAPELLERVKRAMPLGRFGDPETDIAPAVLFLCCDQARFVIGQTIFATGGRFTAL
jgi:3-oxoacyl-[acyl-carrier protein] reductase